MLLASPITLIALLTTVAHSWRQEALTENFREVATLGKDLYERTLEPGQSARFSGTRLWVRIGAPWNVDATLNGKPVRLPASTGDVLVTPAAVRSLG